MDLKKEDRMENDGNDRILIPEREEKLWGQVCRYAQECSWSGGKYLAEAYLKRTGFGEAYIVSHHDGLYEKYGYVHVDTRPAYWGEMQKIYRHIF